MLLQSSLKARTYTMSQRIKNTVISLLALKLIIALIAAFGYFSHPHITRQIDTMGVSMRYAMKFQDGLSFHDFLPTTLASGDFTNEVTPMEFPLLNIITSPVFLIGSKYDYALANIFILCIFTFLFLLNYKEAKNINEQISLAWLITPLYGIPYIFSIRFMPDFFSFLLMSLGIFLFYQDKKKFIATALCAIALLIKPPIIIAFGFLLLKRHWIKQLGYLIISMIPCLLYYTLGIRYLISISHEPGYFAVGFRNPIESVLDFLSSPKEILILITKDLFARYSLVLILVASFISKAKPDIKLFGILALQISAIAILDGEHSFMHSYYYIGTGFITALIFVKYMNHKMAYVISFFLVVINVETGLSQLKTTYRHNLRDECEEIKKAVPEIGSETRIRTVHGPIPELGVCLAKITNSQTAMFGVYRENEKVECENEVFQTKNLVICQYD